MPVTTDAHFTRLIPYIHQNSQKHGFVADFREWRYSSWPVYLGDQPTRLKREAGLGWFEGRERFIQAHRLLVAEREVGALAPDDFD